MSRFPLKERKVTIRDTEVVVRELTRGERNDFSKAVADDKYRGPGLIASMGTVDPKMNEDEANAMPSEVIEDIVREIMDLSGMKTGTKKDAEQKEPDAR